MQGISLVLCKMCIGQQGMGINQNVVGGDSLWGHSLLPPGFSKTCEHIFLFYVFFFMANNEISCLRMPNLQQSLPPIKKTIKTQTQKQKPSNSHMLSSGKER